jgi:uncharacterized membrane protein YdjX (TVP38/TMEM64 family)
LLPYSLLAISAGYSFNHAYDNRAVVLAVGTISVYFGVWLGAIIAFFIGRFILREKVIAYS